MTKPQEAEKPGDSCAPLLQTERIAGAIYPLEMTIASDERSMTNRTRTTIGWALGAAKHSTWLKWEWDDPRPSLIPSGGSAACCMPIKFRRVASRAHPLPTSYLVFLLCVLCHSCLVCVEREGGGRVALTVPSLRPLIGLDMTRRAPMLFSF